MSKMPNCFIKNAFLERFLERKWEFLVKIAKFHLKILKNKSIFTEESQKFGKFFKFKNRFFLLFLI